MARTMIVWPVDWTIEEHERAAHDPEAAVAMLADAALDAEIAHWVIPADEAAGMDPEELEELRANGYWVEGDEPDWEPNI